MASTARSFTLSTPHGLICITDTALKNSLPTLLLLHGNSSGSRIFSRIFSSRALTQRYRIVAFDFPGHGASTNAPNPRESYSMKGYADLAIHILRHLCIREVVVLGWSLGGHVGIEMIDVLSRPPTSLDGGSGGAHTNPKLSGLMLIGAPPALGKTQIRTAFTFPDSSLGLVGKMFWSEKKFQHFARTSAAAGKEDLFEHWMVVDARRMDGRARFMIGLAFSGGVDDNEEPPMGVDQRSVVETSDVLIAVVNGAGEQFVNLEYLECIQWKRLWRGACLRLEGAGHAPFWEKPEVFEGVLGDFLQDCEMES